MKRHLVDDAGNWWRWWSMRLNVVATALLGWAAASPEAALRMILELPAPLRIAAVVALGALVAFTRLYRQPAGEKTDARQS